MQDVIEAIAKREYFSEFVEAAYKENFNFEAKKETLFRIGQHVSKELFLPRVNLRSERERLIKHGKFGDDSPPLKLQPFLENQLIEKLLDATSEEKMVDGDLRSVVRMERALKKKLAQDKNMQKFMKEKLSSKGDDAGISGVSISKRLVSEMLDYVLDYFETRSRMDIDIIGDVIDEKIKEEFPEYTGKQKWVNKSRNKKNNNGKDGDIGFQLN